MIDDYIKLLDVIFNQMFEPKDDKWEIFNNVSNQIENFNLIEFYDKYCNFFEKGKGLDKSIIGITIISNEFLSFNDSGLAKYYQIKEAQIKNVLLESGVLDENNVKHIFNNMCVRAKKSIINQCIDDKILSVNGKLYDGDLILFASLSQYKENRNTNIYNNYINNNGEIGTVIQKISNNDEELYKKILEKEGALRAELDKEYKEIINDLIEAINKKDKKSVLTILSELSSIGSLIATGLMAYF